MSISNEDDTVTYFPCEIRRPKSLREMREIVRRSHKVRAYGGRHSWSAILGSLTMMDTTLMNKILKMPSEDDMEVVVECGVKLDELMRVLASRGYTIPYIPATAGQTVGGSLATATHGSGKLGSMSNNITRAWVVTPEGDVKETTDLWAVSVSLGNFLIYAVGLSVSRDFMVAIYQDKIHYSRLSDKYKSYLDNSQDISLTGFYSPSTGIVTTYTISRNIREDAMVRGRYSDVVNRVFVLPPNIDSLYGKRAESEIAVEASKASKVLKYLNPFLDKISREIKDTVLLRFVSPDTVGVMSMCYKRPSMFISLNIETTENYLPIFRKFGELLKPWQGRPHWGKINFLTREDIHRLYPHYSRYLRAVKIYDPKEKFALQGRVKKIDVEKEIVKIC